MSKLLQDHLNQGSGITSVCSAHPLVLRAAAELAAEQSTLLLIEATSNQVNQFGGYTGMKPADFRVFAEEIVAKAGLHKSKLILGGDHLGPNPWKNLPADEAMQNAIAMVSAYAAAGFTKIHLDASMSLKGDPTPLSDDEVAARSVKLCAAAEASSGTEKPVYVIGTEVPTPGGATHSLSEPGALVITPPEAAAHTLEVHRAAFSAAGLNDAWQRVIAMVVQPGVEFDHDSVVHYDRAKAESLIAWRRNQAASIVFEAHSTDYQLPQAYGALVEDGFAILKVGPALTFALREALDALAAIEDLLVPAANRSNLLPVIDQTMLAHPASWQPYYSGDAAQQALLRRFSYSDRVRYYWHYPEITSAINKLIANLDSLTIPESILSLYLPAQYEHLRADQTKSDAASLIVDKVKDVFRIYASGCLPS